MDEVDSDDSENRIKKTKVYDKTAEDLNKQTIRIKQEVIRFLKKKSIRSKEYMFHQLYPFNAACNEDQKNETFKRHQVSKTMTEIHLPLREIRQLTAGDDNALAR